MAQNRTFEIPVLWGKLQSKLGSEMRRLNWKPVDFYSNGMTFTVNGKKFKFKIEYEKD